MNKYNSDPSYEFIGQGQTKTKKTDEKKEKESDEKRAHKAKIDTNIHQQQQSLQPHQPQ